MQGGILTSTRPAHLGLAPALLASSVVATGALLLGLRSLGVLPDLPDLDSQKMVREFGIRLELSLAMGAGYVVLLASATLRGWTRERRWRELALVLFAAGTVCSMLDPVHQISAEGNWIRYTTSGCLLLGGALAVVNGARRERPTFDRLVGLAFGPLLLAAGADELLQLHEQLGRALAAAAPLRGVLDANDLPTLVVALGGVCVLGCLLLLRTVGGRLGGLLRLRRYRVPLRLFAFAVVTFLVAMLLDSFGKLLQRGVDVVAARLLETSGDWLWLVLLDVSELANAIEEIFEYAAAVALLMMVANLFSIRWLGAGRPRRSV